MDQVSSYESECIFFRLSFRSKYLSRITMMRTTLCSRHCDDDQFSTSWACRPGSRRGTPSSSRWLSSANDSISIHKQVCNPAKSAPQLTVAQPSEVRNSQPSRVEIPNTGNPDGSDLEQRFCPPSRRSRQCEDVDEGETLLVQTEEERGPEEVETELSVVEFERTDSDLAKEEVE